IRAVKGPRVTDRILSVNMIGTMVISSILILSQMLGENYLIDVALIYAMISFLSVIILAAVYIPSRKKREDS
nr:sodium:proton antiporter [Lachnospiraceae bacterium]